MRYILLSMIAFIVALPLDNLSAQTPTVCPIAWNYSGNNITFLSYVCNPTNQCLQTGTYTGQIEWSSPNYVVLLNQTVTVTRTGSDVLISFPAGTTFGNLQDANGFASMTLTNNSTGIVYGFNITGGVMIGTENGGTDCLFPLKIVSTSISSIYQTGVCKVRVNLTVAQSSNMKDVVLERSDDARNFYPISQSSLQNTYSDQSLSLYDNYPKQTKQYYRLRFNELNGGYFFSKILSITSPCAIPYPTANINCSGLSITGNSSMCGTTYLSEYNLQNVPFYAPVTWTITPSDNSIANITVNDYDNIKLSRVGAGNVTLTASVQGCPTVSKDIQVDNIPLAKHTNNGVTKTLSLNTAVRAGQNKIELICPSCTGLTWTGSKYFYPGTGNIINFDLNSGTAWFRVTGSNACGTFTRTYNFYVSNFGYSASPNPSTGLVMLDGQGQDAIIREVRVIDNLGRLFYKKSFPNGVRRTQLDLSHLKPDFYLIQISNGKETKVQQLILTK